MRPNIPPQRLAWVKMTPKERNDYRSWNGGRQTPAETRTAVPRPAPRALPWWRKILG
jgi:hypothetical protein